MLNLLGEYDCKLDAKGRIMFPSKLRKQLEEVIHSGLVINRDIFEKCLVIYPKPEWDKVNQEMSRLSRYSKKHQLFQRKFMKGATMVDLDSTGRLLIPSSLMEYAGIDPKKAKEIKLTGMGERIDVWSKAKYDQNVLEDDQDIDFESLAEEVRKDLDKPGTPGLN